MLTIQKYFVLHCIATPITNTETYCYYEYKGGDITSIINKSVSHQFTLFFPDL